MKWIKGRENSSKLECDCGSRLFAIHETEDGDVFVLCGNCGKQEPIRWG